MDREHASIWTDTRHDSTSLFSPLFSFFSFDISNQDEDEDGFKLYESRAIARYLVRKYAPQSVLVPSTDDVQRYGLFEQAMSVEMFNFAPPLQTILYEKVSKRYVVLFPSIKRHGPGLNACRRQLGLGEANEEVVRNTLDLFEEKLKGYERILAKQKFIAGDVSTLALLSLSKIDRVYPLQSL